MKRLHKNNIYGLCRCGACYRGKKRGWYKAKIDKMKRRLRKWVNGKSNKEPIKGLYTD